MPGRTIMHRRHFIGMSGAVALAAAAGLPRFESSAQAAYSAVDLGVPEGFDSVVPVALNDNGVAVVSASSADATGVFIVENGAFTQVGEPDELAVPSSINEANQVGGW